MHRFGHSALAIYAAAALVFIYAPFFLLVLFAFNTSRFPYWPFQGFSLHWFQSMANGALFSAVLNSLLVALASSFIATVIGAMSAYCISRFNFNAKNAYVAFILLPPCVPLIVLALILLAFLRQVGLANSLGSVVICHVLLTSPLAFGLVRLRLSQVDPEFESAAWNLGASRWVAIRDVVLPLILPSLVAAFLLTMAVSWDEFTIAWFVSGANVTLPVFLWNMFQGQVSAMVNAIGTVSFVGSATLVLAAEALFFRQRASTDRRIDHG
jgi:spermidine/putrescine transport system permease protein